MKKMPALDELIVLAEGRSRSNFELDRLAAAIALSGDLLGLSDGLLDHFVQQCRQAGCSWSQIGDVLGVSKQAAQQRFRGSWVTRVKGRGKRRHEPWSGYTDRARRAVELAQQEAGRVHHNYVGTEHLLLGILKEAGGVGAKALRRLGITLDAARAGVESEIGRGDPTLVTLPIPFTPRAKRALQVSVREARNLGHNYVGTEHLLLALLADPEGVAAKVLGGLGADKDAVIRHVLGLLEG